MKKKEKKAVFAFKKIRDLCHSLVQGKLLFGKMLRAHYNLCICNEILRHGYSSYWFSETCYSLTNSSGLQANEHSHLC